MHKSLTVPALIVAAYAGLPAIAAPTPFVETFDDATTDFTFISQASSGGFTVAGGELNLFVNGGRSATFGGGDTYIAAASVAIDDPINPGFTLTADLTFPNDGQFANTRGDVYLAAGGTDLADNPFLPSEGLVDAGYAIGITQDTLGGFSDVDSSLRLFANGVELDSLKINETDTAVGDSVIGDFIGQPLQLTLTGVDDGLGGLTLTGTLLNTNTTDSISVTGNVAAADLALGDQAGIRVRMETGNDYEFNLDNFGLTVVPEPGSMALCLLSGSLMLARRRRSAK
ncbi:MAG: PEP-CTERM sorting domain-containing protein [Planctomycetota bacterium]